MILALAGGVGGAKLAKGLADIVEPDQLSIVVNVGDDFEHLGLTICPDLDTVCYTLAGINNATQGWGIEGETWAFMDALRRLGGEDWFNLGDRDLATHVLRTQMLGEHSLSDIVDVLRQRFNIAHQIAPATDDRLRSIIYTDEGELAFQDYFVRRRAAPHFRSIRFDGVTDARPSPAFQAALDDPALEMILLCPSNPVLSIEPILAIPGVRKMIEVRGIPVIAVSPFIGGQAVKGPAAKIMEELGIERSPAGLAGYYGGLLDGLVVDAADAGVEVDGLRLHATDTMMRSVEDKRRLALETLTFARSLR